MTTFEWITIIIAIAAPFITTIAGLVRWIMKLNKKIDAMFAAINKIADDVCDIHVIQGAMISSQKTTLEALSGNINGNVAKASVKLDEAQKIWDESVKRNMSHSCAPQ